MNDLALVKVDARDAPLVLARTWNISPQGYVVAKTSRTTLRLHRLILDAQPGEIVDHKNGDKLDCRRANLRLATHTQSICNRGGKSGSETGFKGVYRCRVTGEFRARICIEGTRTEIGRFPDPEQAARAYDEAALRLHGDFARLNFPLPMTGGA